MSSLNNEINDQLSQDMISFIKIDNFRHLFYDKQVDILSIFIVLFSEYN